MILILDREQPNCVTFGYYIIARFASWGPSVPLGGFRPPGICGCSLGLLKYNCMYHRYSKNETSNGDAYSAIIKLKYQNVARFASMILILDREQPKCVTFGYYIIARFASWGPSVPLGGFRPPGMVAWLFSGFARNITTCTIGTTMHIPSS